MKSKLDEKDEVIFEERKKWRERVATEVETRKAVELKVRELEAEAEDLKDDLAEANAHARAERKKTKAALTQKDKARSTAANRLSMLKSLQLRLDTATDALADTSKKSDTIEDINSLTVQIKRERPIGRRGGSGRWPVHVVLLICELLVNGTPPSAVPKNIQTCHAAFRGAEATELPSINFVRETRTVLKIINEVLVGMRLSEADVWHQLFTDGTARRQIALQNLVISVMHDGKLDPVIVSSCMVLISESSDNQVKSIVDMVSTILQEQLLILIILY